MGRDGWPVPPPPGWQPPRWGEQAVWIAGLVAIVALIVDVLVVVTLVYRPWGGQATWTRQMLLCAAIPLNLTALGVGIWWLIRRARR
jgi:ABC-type Fe3+ transport system permease subunit